MCGRYTLTQDLAGFADSLSVKYDPKKHNPRFNICPSQEVAVILNNGSDRISLARWGLVPSWAKDPTIGNKLANARAEGIEAKPSFRSSFKRKRCLVLADGFYEWANRPGQKLKIPYYFRLTSREIFGFAGLWESWKDPTGKTELLTVCLITTTPNLVVEPIHDRMPVILEPRFYKIWLSQEEQPTERLTRCLEPYPAAMMEKYAVSTIVNSPKNDKPECVKRSGESGCR
jgi:putative SOS response-associated peptidase YedK